MNVTIRFTFRKRPSNAYVIIDFTEPPCYFFVDLKDKQLKEEFGEQLSIATDLKHIFSQPDRIPTESDRLKMAIFEAMKTTEEFSQAKSQYPTRLNH